MANESRKKVLLMIADISGYTGFMVSSELEIEHSQHVISELTHSIITLVDPPWRSQSWKVMPFSYTP